MPLSNTTQQVLASTPYFDDYYQANSAANTTMGIDFDFHRVLFRPKYGVQARELTQLQTLLQMQLERLGAAQFRNGDAIIGCQLGLNVDSAVSGQVLANTTLGDFFNRETNTGKYVFSTTNNSRKASVIQYVGIDEGAPNNYLIFTYKGNDTFVPAERIQDRDDAAISATFAAGSPFSSASTISIDEGVCFVSGVFVRVRPQTIVLDPLSATPSYRIGLTIEEQILDELDDVVGESLGDPANNGAPGAHRLRVRLTLAKKSLSTDADDNFIELTRVVNGVLSINKPANVPVSMRELLEILARRTYDESGDYMVRQFPPVIERASLANNTNSAEVPTFLLSLGSGKAYVRGSEIETTTPTRLNINKARETVTVDDATLATTVGNYMIVSRVGTSTPQNFFGNTGTVDLHCLPVTDIDTTNATSYAYSRIGTTRVRMLEVDNVPDDITNYANSAQYFNASTYKLFFFDTRFDTLNGNVTSATTDATTGRTTLYAVSSVNGLPHVNNALDGVSIAIQGTASGIYTIDEYLQANATHVSVLLKEYLTSTPTADTPYRLLFQPRDIDAFAVFDAAADMSAPYVDYLSFQAEVAGRGKDSGLPTGYSKIFNPNDNSLVYQIPELYLTPGSVAPESVEFVSWIASDNTTTTTGSTNADVTLSWSTLQSHINFPLDTDASSESASEHFLLFDITNDDNGGGRLIHFSDTANASSRCATNTAISDHAITFTYHHGGTISSARTLMAIGKAELTGVAPRLKTYYVGNTTHALAGASNALLNGQVEYHTLNTAPGAVYSFKTADVINLQKVLYKSSNTAFADADMTTATDVTSYFTLETGQRDNTYDYSSAIVKRGASGVIAPTGRLLFIFDWFNHTGQGYVHLDSYLSSPNVAKGFAYEDVPSFTSPKSNRTISLRNVIDFRPVQSNKEFLAAGTMVMASSNTSANTTYLTNNTEKPYLIPVSDRNWEGSYAYYLSRMDRVLLYPNGSLVVKEGTPAKTPDLPPADADAMLLFDLNVPAYTLVDDTGVPTGVKIKSYDYKRYTMKDLSKIEDRVAHLEYYTALSQLEKSARDQSELDADNQERFKNGIVVDAFTGTSVADVTRPDFVASIDTRNRMLRPAFEYVGYNASSSSDTSPQITFMPDLRDNVTSNMKVIGDLATLAYDTDVFIAQPLATRHVSVNPFNIANYNGRVILEPAVDTGKSLAPAQVIDMGGPTEAWVKANLPSYTNWGEWETTWTGVIARERRQEWWTPEGWSEDDHAFEAMSITTFEDITTQTTFARHGTQFDFSSKSTTTSIGNVIIDSYVIHNMRQRDVVFAASGMKANTIVYPFFDGSNVSAFVQQSNALRLEPCPISTKPSFKIGDTVYVQKPLTGNVSVAAGSTTMTGTGTAFNFELGAAQLIKIAQGSDAYTRVVSVVSSDTALTLDSAAPTNLPITGGRVYSLTPVTVADVTERTYYNTDANGAEYVQISLKVVRINHHGQPDDIVPYTIQAGSLSPAELISASAGTTNTASIIAPERIWTRTSGSAFAEYLAFAGDPSAQEYGDIPITAATIRSGVVRAYNASAHTLRLDLDTPATSNADIAIGTQIYFVNEDAAGQSSLVTAYNALTQTVTLDSTIALTNITTSTIYSLGALRTDGFLAVGATTTGLHDSTASLNGAVVTSASGTCAGALHIQENQFPVGARVFRLIDSATNTPASATTRAEGIYTASGLIQVESATSVTTREIVRTSRGVSDTESRINRSTTNLGTEWVDPLAQSFLIDSVAYPSGLFLTSVDIVFAAKPPVSDETPIRIELRPMVNGYPSSTEIVSAVSADGRAAVELRPNQVNVTATPNFDAATNYTRFTFSAPVHLRPGEYAVVLLSNSDEYRVYTAAVSETVLGTQNIVGAQPYAGSFFKSQNASTWSAEQNEDLMFRLNKAEWNVGDTGRLVLRAAPYTANAAYDTLTLYSYDGTFEGQTSLSYEARVMPMNVTTGDMTGSIGVSYAIVPTQTLYLPMRAMMLGRPEIALSERNRNRSSVYPLTYSTANTINLTARFSTQSRDVAPFIDLKKLHAVGVRHLLNDMPLHESQFEITSAGSGYPTTSRTGTVSFTSGDTRVTGSSTAFTTTLIVGRDVVIGGNLAVTVANVINDTSFNMTEPAPESRAANTYATYANAIITIEGSDAGDNATAIGVVGAVSSANVTGILKGIALTNPGTGYLTSPTVLADGATIADGTVVYRGEDWIDGGNGATRYMIKQVTLADGFEARDLKVYFDAVRPVGANFYVYYRALGATDDRGTLITAPWQLMYQDTDDAIISTNPKQFREFVFSTLNNTTATADDTSERFRAFAIKIVMAHNTTAGRIIPAVRNFRAIALDN